MTEQLPPIVRSAVEAEVRFAERIIETLAVPYEVEVPVDDVYGVYGETIGRESFTGIERRARRVKVLRDHRLERAVGACTSIDSRNERGLLAIARIARTDLGDETLALADAGVLDVSIAARPLPGSDQWSDDRLHVRRTKLFMEELSLVGLGVYGEAGAGVLAVRSAGGVGSVIDELAELAPVPSRTPRLDAVRAWRAEARYCAASRPPV
jgi:phage head maturation protease